MKSKLLVSVNHFGRIPPLYQDGPILHPIWVDVKTAHTLVSCHYKTFEHNPVKLSEKVLLTLENVMKDNFPPFIPTVKPEEHDGGSPVEITKSVELPKPDRVKESSEVTTNAAIVSTEVSHDDTLENKDDAKSNKEEMVDSVVEDASKVEELKEASTAPMSLNERAAALGIDTTGMSRNKIRAAIKEKENKK